MSTSSVKSSPKRGRHILINRLDAFLQAREELVARVKAASITRDERIAEAMKQYWEEIGDAPTRLVKLEEGLTAFLERHHYQLTRSLSKTIKREAGEVKVVLRAIELEIPGSEKPIIDWLLERRGGKRYLSLTWKLNRRALLQAPSELFSQLAPFGAWRGRHRQISVKSASSTDAVTISQKRFNER